MAVLLFWPRSFPLDDAYITLHNARSLLGGEDRVFGVHPLIGATSAVHLAVIAALGLVLPLPVASLAVSAICGGLYALGLWRLHPHWAFVLTGLLAGYVPIQLLNGLETSMALAAATWALVLADSRYLPLLLGVLPFIRPDLAFLAAPLGFRRLRTDPVRMIGLAALAAAPFALWTFIATGVPFPNTAAAKIAFFAEYDQSFVHKTSIIGSALVSSFIVMLAGGLTGLWRTTVGRCGLFYMAAVLASALVSMPGAVHWNHFRYLAPFVPILCYGLVTLSDKLLVALSLVSFLTGAVAIEGLRHALTVDTPQRFEAAAALHRLPPNAVVLAHDIGIFAWANPNMRLVDMVGLKTPSSVDHMKHSAISHGRWGPALDSIARQSGAQYAIVLQEFFWKDLGTNLGEMGWTLETLKHGRFEIYRLTPPA